MSSKIKFILSVTMSVILMCSTLSMGLTSVYAIGDFPVSAIADEAEKYADWSYGGQCKQFVNDVVYSASGGTMITAPGYQSSFSKYGVEVSFENAVRGDIIQITPADSLNDDYNADDYYDSSQYDSQLHTMVILENLGNGNFNVIQSNYNNAERVMRTQSNLFEGTEGSIIKIWRLGSYFLPLPAKERDNLFGGTGYDTVQKINHTHDGGYIVCGLSSSSSSGEIDDVNRSGVEGQGYDAFIAKFNAYGTKEWDVLHGGTSTSNDYEIFSDVIEISDGGYLAVGSSTNSLAGETNNGGHDGLVAKFDTHGNIEWNYLYGGLGNDQFISVTEAADGGFIIVGASWGSSVTDEIDDINNGEQDGLIIKIDSSGIKQWDNLFGGPGSETLMSVSKTQDGGFIVAGSSSSSDSGEISCINGGFVDGLIAKFDSNGFKVWDRLYDQSSLYDAFTSVIETNTGNYVVAGTCQPAYGSYYSLVAKYDLTGDIVWSTSLSQDTTIYEIEETNDGGFITVGSSSVSRNGDGHMLKLSSNGDVVSESYFGGSEYDRLISVSINSYGTVFVAGESESSESGDIDDESNGGLDGLIVQFGVTNPDYDLPHLYYCTFDANGATNGSSFTSETHSSNSFSIAIPDSGDLYKEGHTFVGWNSEPDGSGVEYKVGWTVSSDALGWTFNGSNGFWQLNPLYARWVANYDNEAVNIEINETFSEGTTSVNLTNGFDPNVFYNPSTSYIPYLAEMSSVIASAASTDRCKDAFSKMGINTTDTVVEGNVEKSLYYYSYTDNDFLTSTNNDYVSYSFGLRKILCNDQVNNLILIDVRGTYDFEWVSNFNIANPNYPFNLQDSHQGFLLAANRMMCNFEVFRNNLVENGIDLNINNTKIWITGHSRGAAVANLAAHQLNTYNNYSTWVSQDNIYAYTFATPNVSVDANFDYEPNIFNFTIPTDFVTKVPLNSNWGYYKYGRSIEINPESLSNFDGYFTRLTSVAYNSTLSNSDIDYFINNIISVAPTVYSYYNNVFRYIDIIPPYIIFRSFSPNDYFHDLSLIISKVDNLSSLPINDLLQASSIVKYTPNIDNFAFSNLLEFFIINAKLNSNMQYNHAPETYISYVKAFNDSFLKEAYFTKDVSINSDSESFVLSDYVRGDLVVSSSNVRVSNSPSYTYAVSGNMYISGNGAIIENLVIWGNVIIDAANVQVKDCLVKGNLSITNTGVNIVNSDIEGNLLISKTLKNGRFSFNGSSVSGSVTIFGGGSNSIYFNDCQLGQVIVNKDYSQDSEIVHIGASGNTNVNNLIVAGSAILENDSLSEDASGIATVKTIASDETFPVITLRGAFSSFTTDNGLNIQMESGSTINQLIVESNSDGLHISGSGSIDTAIISENILHSIQIDVPIALSEINEIISIAPYITEPTNQDFTVTASSTIGILNSTSHTFTENSSYDFIATDIFGHEVVKTVTITNIDKVAPEIVCSVKNDYDIFPLGTAVLFEGSDPNNIEPVDLVATLKNGFEEFEIQSGYVPSAGVYKLVITAIDNAGNTTEKTINFVVFDPNGGFVTGGGWINSPQGAYTVNPDLSGKATFGFVAKYLRGTIIPTGQTEFKFEIGNMSFNSTSYQWLVVAGSKAQFKGIGTINGSGKFGFLLTTVDGTQNECDDRFRIKIWDIARGEIIYDNQIYADDSAGLIEASTALGGGSIMIHK